MKKNKKIINKILIILFFIIFVLLCYKVIQIYAVFKTETNSTAQFQKGAWHINVNGVEITKGVDKKFTINNIFINQDNHVKPGKLAPGLNGNFNIEINPQNTDVSIKYDIMILDNNKLIKIKEIKEINNEVELIKTNKNTYTAIIPLSKIKEGIIHKINVKFEWLNDENKNLEDTILGEDTLHKFEIPVMVHLEQYLGEEIRPIQNVL